MPGQMKTLADMGKELGELTQQKNAAYGDSFQKSGDVLRLLFPNGIKPEQYRDVLGIARVVDKLFRIATRKGAFGESPWRDIAGYGIVAAMEDAREIARLEKQARCEDDGPCYEDAPVLTRAFSVGERAYVGNVQGVIFDTHFAPLNRYGVRFDNGHEYYYLVDQLKAVP